MKALSRSNPGIVRYNLIQLELDDIILNSSIVVVEKRHFDLSKDSLGNYLVKNSYTRSDVRVGELKSKVNSNTNLYELEESNDNISKFNLILFVNNNLLMNQEFLPETLEIIGAIEIPKIGVDNPTTEEKILIEFILGEVKIVLDPKVIYDIEQTFKIYNYSDTLLGSDGYDSNDLSDTFPSIHESEHSDVFGKFAVDNQGIHFSDSFLNDLGSKVGEEIVYNQLPLRIDFSSLEDVKVKSTQEVYYKFKTYLHIECNKRDGELSPDQYLISYTNESLRSGEYIYKVDNPENYIQPLDNDIEIKIKGSKTYKTFLSPDFIVFEGDGEIRRIATNLYQWNKFKSIEELMSSPIGMVESELIQQTLNLGLDIQSIETCMVNSDPDKGLYSWLLQPKHLRSFNGWRFEKISPVAKLKLDIHNNKFFVVKDLSVSGVETLWVFDYKGNMRRLESDNYKITVDGIFICKYKGKFRAYVGNFNTEVILNNILDLNTLYPTAPGIEWNDYKGSGLNIDLNRIIIYRGTFNLIDYNVKQKSTGGIPS